MGHKSPRKHGSPTAVACVSFPSRREKIIFDVNVLIKAMEAEEKGAKASIVETQAHWAVLHALKYADIYASSAIMGEMKEMMGNSALVKTTMKPAKQRAYFLFFQKHMKRLEPAETGFPRCSDPLDGKYLAAAYSPSVRIDRLVSNDGHLTSMSLETRMPIRDVAAYVSTVNPGINPNCIRMSDERMFNLPDFPTREEVEMVFPSRVAPLRQAEGARASANNGSGVGNYCLA